MDNLHPLERSAVTYFQNLATQVTRERALTHTAHRYGFTEAQIEEFNARSTRKETV